MARFSACGRTLYYAGCQREDGFGGCDILQASFENGEVFDVEYSPGFVNSEAWESQPVMSCDEQSLYFSSNRIKDKLALWYATLLASLSLLSLIFSRYS